MNGVDAMQIQVRRLSRRKNNKSFVAREEAVEIVVEIVMLHKTSACAQRGGGVPRQHPHTSPEDEQFFDLSTHKFTRCRTRFPVIFGADRKSSLKRSWEMDTS